MRVVSMDTLVENMSSKLPGIPKVEHSGHLAIELLEGVPIV